MTGNKTTYINADAWRHEAMQRPTAVELAESRQRQAKADAHNRQHNIADADTLADQQLYILGKMDLGEYQDYLLFKYSEQQVGRS